MNWDNLAERLSSEKYEGEDVVAYISDTGALLDICEEAEFVGTEKKYVVVDLPFNGSGEDLERICNNA